VSRGRINKNNKFENTWNETVMAELEVVLKHFRGEAEKTMKNIYGTRRD
jgi:hypothetical protein